MEKSKFKKIFAQGTVFVWMAVIFVLSSMRGSGENYYDPLYFIERKTFHVIEYFILSTLFFLFFSRNLSQKKSLVFAMGCSFLYACSDEWHQTFVFGRDGTVWDVAVDSIGILIAVFVILKFKKYVFSYTGKNLENQRADRRS
jgi:VanZ family protein